MGRSFKACGSIGPLYMLLAVSGSSMAATYTGIDCPDSFQTQARGINDRGDIVGLCRDANGFHGYRLRKGVFQLIDFPGAPTTFATESTTWVTSSGATMTNAARTAFCSVTATSRRSMGPGRPNRKPKVSTISERSSASIGIARVSSGDSFSIRAVSGTLWCHRLEITGLGNRRPGSNRRRLQRCQSHSTWVLSQHGNFRTIHPPGAVGARAFGVNVLGHVVGGSSDLGPRSLRRTRFLFTTYGRYRNLSFLVSTNRSTRNQYGRADRRGLLRSGRGVSRVCP